MSTTSLPEKYEILIEKYRPKKFDEIIGQDKVVKRLKRYVASKNLPNLLFTGPAGVGKTTSALTLARELYGLQWKSNFLEINASDERGINVIRGIVKNYAEAQSIGDIKFKIIFLDEADALTNDAQSALRRTMEKYTASCRFVLSCNYQSKLIEPIQSRCSVFRFKRIPSQLIIDQCKYVCDQEKILIDNQALEAISYLAEGDCRKAINFIDTSLVTKYDINNQITTKSITIEDIYEISSYIEPKSIVDIIKKALSREFFVSKLLLDNLLLDGISAEDILKQMITRVIEMNIDQKLIIDLIDIIGETDWRISEGANENIAFHQMIANMVKLGSEQK